MLIKDAYSTHSLNLNLLRKTNNYPLIYTIKYIISIYLIVYIIQFHLSSKINHAN